MLKKKNLYSINSDIMLGNLTYTNNRIIGYVKAVIIDFAVFNLQSSFFTHSSYQVESRMAHIFFDSTYLMALIHSNEHDMQ